jgi:4-amino-4-deoxy-L-arabinose transferase-like glycosyltransferase
MEFSKKTVFYVLLCWLVLAAAGTAFLSFDQGDELHYLGIAWNMFKAHSWLDTYLATGVPDFQKTPLLYWPILAGWRLFGVSEVWPRLVTYAIGTANLFLTYLLAEKFFPEKKQVGLLAVLVLICNLYWPEFCGRVRFEGLVTLFGLASLLCGIHYVQTRQSTTLILTGVLFGFALLAKGACAYIYYLPLLIFLPLLFNQAINKRWMGSLIAVLCIAAAIPGLYLAYIYCHHGMQVLHTLLFDQISQRVKLHFSADVYLILAINLLPVVGLLSYRKVLVDARVLLLLGQVIFTLLFFSMGVNLSAKHYLIPIYPLIAIILAYSVCTQDLRHALIFAGVFCLGMSFLMFYEFDKKRSIYQNNLVALATKVAQLQRQGYATAQFIGIPGYQNLDFLGRLPNDLLVLTDPSQQKIWLAAHPNGVTITKCSDLSKDCYLIRKNERLRLNI